MALWSYPAAAGLFLASYEEQEAVTTVQVATSKTGWGKAVAGQQSDILCDGFPWGASGKPPFATWWGHLQSFRAWHLQVTSHAICKGGQSMSEEHNSKEVSLLVCLE